MYPQDRESCAGEKEREMTPEEVAKAVSRATSRVEDTLRDTRWKKSAEARILVQIFHVVAAQALMQAVEIKRNDSTPNV